MEDRITPRAPLWLLLSAIVITMLLWVFAFMEMPQASPEWLARAQAVCFGKTESGLPGPSGWIILILSPLLLMSSLYITYADDLSKNIREMFSSKSGMLILLLLLLTGAGESAWVANRIRDGLNTLVIIGSTSGSLPANYPKTSVHVPEFSLINQLGKRISLSDFKGRPVILSFIFAHCQSVCPVLVHSIKAGHALTMQEQAAVLLITLDPLRDTPASLPSLALKWELSDQEYVLSGSQNEVEETIKSFNVPTSRDEKNGDIVHPALVYVIDRDGSLAFSFNNPSPEWIMEAIKRL